MWHPITKIYNQTKFQLIWTSSFWVMANFPIKFPAFWGIFLSQSFFVIFPPHIWPNLWNYWSDWTEISCESIFWPSSAKLQSLSDDWLTNNWCRWRITHCKVSSLIFFQANSDPICCCECSGLFPAGNSSRPEQVGQEYLAQGIWEKAAKKSVQDCFGRNGERRRVLATCHAKWRLDRTTHRSSWN